MKRRIGRFYASRAFVESGAVRSVFMSCAIVRCELLFMNDCFEYLAISPLFDELEEGELAPTYEWIASKDEPLGQIVVKAVRQP